MLISLDRKFIFVANTKTGSTTIEALLGPECEIAIAKDTQLKHLSIGQIERQFRPMFRKPKYKIDKFFRFGVMRDPIDWVTSWFNYRSRPELRDRPRKRQNYTGDVSFIEFCAALVSEEPPPYAQLGAQTTRFSANGKLAVDAIIDHARLVEGFAAIADEIGTDLSDQLSTKRLNASSTVRLASAAVNVDERTLLEERFARDIKLYDRIASAPDGVLRL